MSQYNLPEELSALSPPPPPAITTAESVIVTVVIEAQEVDGVVVCDRGAAVLACDRGGGVAVLPPRGGGTSGADDVAVTVRSIGLPSISSSSVEGEGGKGIFRL